MVKEQPHNSILLKAYSDSPTYTTGRVRSLGTGTFPRILELKNQFKRKT